MTGRMITDRVDELTHTPKPSNRRHPRPPPLRLDPGPRMTPGTVLIVRVSLLWRVLTRV